MSKRLFVGGLPYSLTNSELQEMFAKLGVVVSCTIITDRVSGRSKGFGFVEMENDEDADKAINTLNGTEIDGRKITVNVARPLEEREPRSFEPRRFDDNRGGSFRKDRGSSRGGRRY